MGRQQAPELRRGGVEMLCSMPAQPASTVRLATVPVKSPSLLQAICMHHAAYICLLFPCLRYRLAGMCISGLTQGGVNSGAPAS